MNLMRVLILFFLFFVFSACSTAPYVYKAGQFNRSSDNFGKTDTDISNVTVCYSKFSAAPEAISKLALSECARFGKSVKFIEHDYNLCPLTAPVGAFYECVGEKAIVKGQDTQGVSKGTLMIYDGYKFRY